MRRIASAAVIGLLVSIGLIVPGASAASPPQPRVVIIVGPVGGSTAAYKADADAAYAEARKYTTDVTRVYTPNATWTAARRALQGASVVIYLGHGNGFPSPYRSSPWPYSENGLGLNPKAGVDNTTTRYYGEYYLARDVVLAPNAIVLLHHLCYASGNSESGRPLPNLTQAKQRVDNMAAGWLRTGARAVVAEAHYSPAWYVRQLFTTHKTVDRIFHDAPSFNGHAFTFRSSRTPGASAEMDPDGTPGGYWRAVTGWLSTPTDDITGASYADTGVDPTDFVVPGAASVNVDAAAVYADETLSPGGDSGPSATLPRDTRLRLLARGATTAVDGAPVFQVATLDGSSSGWMSGADLLPRDSASPVVWTADDGDGAVSPNGDGRGDTERLTGRLSEVAAWTVRYEAEDGTVLATVSGSGDTFDASWDGLSGGAPLPDGTYRWTVVARDGWGNPDGTRSGTFTIDTEPPSFGGPLPGSPDGPPTFSPNGDGSAETIGFPFAMDEPGYVDAAIDDGDGAHVRSLTARVGAGAGTLSWDGRDDAGRLVPDGLYTVLLRPRDLAGNVGLGRTAAAAVYTTLSHVLGTRTVFFPQDLDRYARTARFSFDLSGPATVSATIRDPSGAVVRTMIDAAQMTAGTHVFDWDGRRDDGTMATRGTYWATIGATDGALGATGRVALLADGFRITISDTTPARGQTVTLYATSPEPLSAAPRLRVSQPGTAAFSLTMKKMSASVYKVIVKLRSTGTAGTVRFSISGTDPAGGINRGSRVFALH